jgi:hypothetical protein
MEDIVESCATDSVDEFNGFNLCNPDLEFGIVRVKIPFCNLVLRIEHWRERARQRPPRGISIPACKHGVAKAAASHQHTQPYHFRYGNFA